MSKLKKLSIPLIAALLAVAFLSGESLANRRNHKMIAYLSGEYHEGLSDACMLHPDACLSEDKKAMEAEGYKIIHGKRLELVWTRDR